MDISLTTVTIMQRCDHTRAEGGAILINSTYQLIGKYLMFKGRSTTNVQNAQDFYLWLKSKGITSHTNDIVEAVAEKVRVYMHPISITSIADNLTTIITHR